MNSLKVDQDFLLDIDVSGLCHTYFELDEIIRLGSESELSVSCVVDEGLPFIKKRLLKLVNSELYQPIQSVDTVADVVRLIGHAQVRDLVLAISLIEVLKKLSPDIVSRESFWKHSVACALCSALLGSYSSADQRARYFLAGLLHDVGSLLVYSQISEKTLMRILKKRYICGALYELESEEIGYNHAQAGGQLAMSLDLPLWLNEAISYHHDPMRAPHHQHEATVVHLADIVVNAMRYGSRGEFLVPPLVDGAWESLALPVSVLETVIEQIDQQTPSIFAALLDE